MSAITVVLDASNIACVRQQNGRIAYRFSRVEEVRDYWLKRHPEDEVRAILDASAYRRMVDEPRARRAEQDSWLETATGDADDRILDLADRYRAAIVSKDNFTFAREEYPWLQGSRGRVFLPSWRKGALLLQPRVLRVATPQEIAKAQDEKRAKAGIRNDLGDRAFRCTAPPDICDHGGALVQHALLREMDGIFYCVACQHRAQEEFLDPVVPESAGEPRLTVMHHQRVRHELSLGSQALILGRGGSSRPHVHDVTAGLPNELAVQIAREHLEAFLDDDGNLIVRHLSMTNASFLNPSLGSDGLPSDNRLADFAEYSVSENDEIHLGPGVVRLIVGVPRSLPT
ncbi:FHA domain-containing protein [Microbispora amethystogenes]|uniref:FHA domain-containing protein n=1 Tax=Microbispora amethystogenes TaxID=1427754 RepID=UPI0019544797|nr:FHA domain-containing protein [Microbispora amethystogenes]